MAQLRHMIPKSDEKALWDTKDGLALLSGDPLQMHKGKFVNYLKAKGEALLEDYLSVGMDPDEAHAKMSADLAAIAVDWKEEARRRHQ